MKRLLIWTVSVLLALVLLHNVDRILFFDKFIIPSESMRPTLIPGDRIVVDKTIFGARIYKDLHFGEGIPLSSFRTRGRRAVRPNDIVVFNAPFGYRDYHLEFKINYVYCKRCVGCPGDSISFSEGFYHNNHFNGIIGVEDVQRLFAAFPDSLIQPKMYLVYPFVDEPEWNLKRFGPIYVPKAGDTLVFDNYLDIKLYAQIVEYEMGQEAIITKDGRLLVDGMEITEHTVRNNYYYFCGDNVFSSRDSRYLGFVPEEFIIGVATRILCSHTGMTWQWDRTFKELL